MRTYTQEELQICLEAHEEMIRELIANEIEAYDENGIECWGCGKDVVSDKQVYADIARGQR